MVKHIVLFKLKENSIDNCIKAKDRKSRIAVGSLQNYDDVPWISDMNRHLKNIADSERCEYGKAFEDLLKRYFSK